ncbi:MAG: hypothetical protein PF636_06610 [Actinomycetota bacterium]|jgi:hypothetical protein|nr:hypothetical protein [Actinomycetota bacterium]
MNPKPLRSLLSVLMNLLILLAVVLTVKVVIVFFGSLSSQEWANAMVSITDLVTIPFGAADIATPYGGVFDVEAAVTIGGLLLLEWGLSSARSRA